jgi:hypothetical protein
MIKHLPLSITCPSPLKTEFPPPDHTCNYDQRNSVPRSRNWVIEGITWKVIPRRTLPLEAAFAKALVGVKPDWQKERNLLKTRRPACPKTATSPTSPNQEDQSSFFRSDSLKNAKRSSATLFQSTSHRSPDKQPLHKTQPTDCKV